MLGVEVAGQAGEADVDADSVGELLDPVDRLAARAGHQSSAVGTEVTGDGCVTRVDRFGQMRRRAAGFAGAYAFTLDDRHRAAGAGEDDRGGQTRNPCADDDDIGLQPVAQGWEASKLVRGPPERFVAYLHDRDLAGIAPIGTRRDRGFCHPGGRRAKGRIALNS
jgi:hypothetical protein